MGADKAIRQGSRRANFALKVKCPEVSSALSMGSRVQAVVYLGWILLSVIPGIGGVSELAMVLMLPLTGSNCELATLHWKAALQGLSLEALVRICTPLERFTDEAIRNCPG